MVALFYWVVLNSHILVVTSGEYFIRDDLCLRRGHEISDMIRDRYPKAKVQWQCDHKVAFDS